MTDNKKSTPTLAGISLLAKGWVEKLNAEGIEATTIELLCTISAYDASSDPYARRLAALWLVAGERQVIALCKWLLGQNTGHEQSFVQTFEKYLRALQATQVQNPKE